MPKLDELTPEQYEHLKLKVEEAVGNCVKAAKRSLLDWADFFQSQLGSDETRPLVEMIKRRTHNDISQIGHQVMAIFRIFESGGVIPPFGRTPEEMATDAVRRRKIEAAEPNTAYDLCGTCGGGGLVEKDGTLWTCRDCNGVGRAVIRVA